MELRRFLFIVRRRLALLVVLILVGLAAAYLGTSRTSVYSAQATLYIGEPSASLNPTSQYGAVVLAATIASTVPTASVVNQALSYLHRPGTVAPRKVSEVVKNTTATVQTGTNLIRVSVRDTDPVLAQELANNISNVFIANTRQLLPVIAALGGPRNEAVATIDQQAVVPTSPLATNLKRNVALGGLVGLLVGVALVLLLGLLGLSARTPHELEDMMGMSLLGVVPLQPQIEQSGAGEPDDRPGDLLLLKADDA